MRLMGFGGILYNEEKTQAHYLENYLTVFPFGSLGLS